MRRIFMVIGLIWALGVESNVIAGDPNGIENGDVNGDARRDISDAVYLLANLFLGGPTPVEGSCSIERCDSGDLLFVENGDTNGDRARDLSDAVYLLNWLFLAGSEIVPICACESSCRDCEGDCVPDGPDSFVCVTDLETCDDVQVVYDYLTLDYGKRCAPDESCQLVFGHCGVALGGCYYAVSPRVTQAQLDALSVRYQELGGVFDCGGGAVCRCAAPPDVTCRDGNCELDL